MKKRLLSALLALCMMLTMMPAVAFAADKPAPVSGEMTTSQDGTEPTTNTEPEQPDTEVPGTPETDTPEEPGMEIPPETCDVEYKEQSEGVEYIGAEYVNNTYILDFEITEDAPSDSLVIDLGNAMMSALSVGDIPMPGDTFKYQVWITNHSGRTYTYKDGSLVISTADTDEFGNLEEGSLLPVLGYDGQYLPISFAGHMLPGFFGFGTSFKELCQVYDYLEEKGYTGENALTRYMLDKLNTEHGTEYTSLADLVIEHPSWLSTSSGVEHNGIYTMSEEELLSYIGLYPWINKFVYAKPNGDQLDVQIKWPEGELAAATYDAFYQQLLSFVFGKENVERLNPNPNPSGDLDFARAHGIGQYQNGSALYEEANQYFQDLMANGLQDDATIELDLAWGLDGPTSNMYQSYAFSYYNIIELEEVKPVTITPADITIYTGGASYGSVVGDNGEEIGAANNGLPAPGYFMDLPGYVTNWLAERGVSLDQEDAADLAGCLSFYYYDGDGTTPIRRWDLVNQGVYSRDTAGNINRYVYSLSPNRIEEEDYGVEVRLQFTDPDDPNGEPIISDDITMAADLVSDTYDMTIYGGGLDQSEIKAVFTAGGQSLTCDVDIGTGELLVKSTTDINTTTNAIESSENAVSDNTITAVAGADTKYFVNESEVTIDSNRVQLLVDEVSNNEEFNADMGSDAVSKVQAEAPDMRNLSYDTAYMDLVDIENGNTVATTDNPLTIYWPAPSNAASDSKYYIAHYTDMNREAVTDADDLAAAETDLIEGKLETVNGNEYVKFDVSSFSPFVLVWETRSGGGNNGGGGGGHDKPDDLNTEDHFAYIIGYPKDYQTGEPTDDESRWPVEPQGNITRAEVATIFFRMLTDEARDRNWSQTNSYTDVASTDWYNNAISTLSNMGIISGDPSGAFRPDDSITRAEFTKIAAGFFDKAGDYVDGTYEDVSSSDWYADFIDAAVDLGLIEGYPDGTIRPEATITRAEACTIVNRTLGRVPDKDHLLPADEMRVWPDNSDTDEWYYAQIQEATNSHDYEWIGEEGSQIENWTEKLEDRDWAQLEREWSDANSAPGGEVVD